MLPGRDGGRRAPSGLDALIGVRWALSAVRLESVRYYSRRAPANTCRVSALCFTRAASLHLTRGRGSGWACGHGRD